MSYYKKGCESQNERYIHIAKDDSDIYKDTKTHEILSDFVILERLNEQDKEISELKQTIKGVYEILSIDVDVFSDKATEHDINAYIELNELDNKDAYYIAKGTKKAIELLKKVM